jgi:cell division protein ZapE
MTPRSAYHAAIDSGAFEPDPAQAEAARALTRLHRELSFPPPPTPASGLFARLLPGFQRTPAGTKPPVRGLYLWGTVGRGKTWLMDLFVDTLPFAEKRRVHFHRFMQGIHADMQRLKGRPEPLRAVAAETAAHCRVLCLDEMQVNDITDAMIMGGLLQALFERGVCLVTTANVAPDGLYRAGLQRDRFLPAIALIHRHCEILELPGPTDYRLRRLRQAPVYLTPLDRHAETALARYFSDVTAARHRHVEPIIINGREIPAVAWGDGAVWFNFDVICHIPRSKLDYVELARCFHTVLLSNLRRLDDDRSNIAHRLITLIDALYDRNVNLIASAEAPVTELYLGRDLAFEFQRTASRLIEMQSHDYLARTHLA